MLISEEAQKRKITSFWHVNPEHFGEKQRHHLDTKLQGPIQRSWISTKGPGFPGTMPRLTFIYAKRQKNPFKKLYKSSSEHHFGHALQGMS